MSDPRYPVGTFSYDITVKPEERAGLLAQVAAFPAGLRALVKGRSEADLERTYRPGGWTVRQVVHHVADSHMNGYIRCKLALTEDKPRISPYDEGAWAQLADVREIPIESSLAILEHVHARWVAVFRAMQPSDFDRPYMHPEHGRLIPIGVSLASYAWHGRHHEAHVRIALSGSA